MGLSSEEFLDMTPRQFYNGVMFKMKSEESRGKLSWLVGRYVAFHNKTIWSKALRRPEQLGKFSFEMKNGKPITKRKAINYDDFVKSGGGY